VIHYHGTPITPRAKLYELAGKSFCVSFAHPRDADVAVQIGQQVMFDNGAFSAYTQGKIYESRAFMDWVEQYLSPPHWAVIPDCIGEDVKKNMDLLKTWRFPPHVSAPVWHLDLPIPYLLRLCDDWPRVCFGSSGEYWEVGSAKWAGRVNEAFNAITQSFGTLPWIHMMRGLDQSGRDWPFASADSCNVAVNHSEKPDIRAFADRIDSVQCPLTWVPKPIQTPLFDATLANHLGNMS
tara:strand:- start:27 stop:737 length:711 start_codon:yes stop_codon:yes gene_type:complete